MACYHFTLKLDRKPDNTPVSAETHLDYISRDGRFTDLDFKRALAAQQFVGNMLCPVQTQDKEAVTSLYRSVFGSIIDNGIGIETSDKASVETIQIALAIAKQIYGNTLDVRGDTQFRARVLVAANEMDFPIHFNDEAMNAQYLKMQEDKENGRRGFTVSRNGRTERAGVHLTRLKTVGKQRPPQGRVSLQALSQRSLDEGAKTPGMLLPRYDAASLEQSGPQRHPAMRRDVSRSIRIKAEDTAKKILSQGADSVLAASHADYINRKENFAAKGGCIYTAHHLPQWANGSPKAFFKAADIYERVNGTRYREIEFALPNELSLAQQQEIIQQFIDLHLKDHYYAYAIHDKIGAMSNGEHNTHVHIMFSDRELDALEREHERTPQMFFHRANSKDPAKGGCPKAKKWNDKNRAQFLCQLRADFAIIQNSVLEKYGVKERVDHRSLKAQYVEALRNGNKALARILDRMSEAHIGPTAAADKNNAKVIDLMAYRQYKIERSELLHAAHVIEASLEDENTQNTCAALLADAKNITQDAENNEATASSDAAKVVALKNLVKQKMQEISALQEIIIWQPQAMQMAREKFMTKEERETCRKLDDLRREHSDLTRFQIALPEPTGLPEKATRENYNRIMDCMNNDIAKLQEQIKDIEPQVFAIESRLSEKEQTKAINAIASKILHNDFPQKQRLQKTNAELSQLVNELKAAVQQEISRDVQALTDGYKRQTRFTAGEISSHLKHSYTELSKTYKQQQHQADMLKKQVISFERAEAIAKNIYLKGGMKHWREEKRQLEKGYQALQRAKIAYEQEANAFAVRPKPRWYQSNTGYNAKAAAIEKMRTDIQNLEVTYEQKNSQLQTEIERMNALCSSQSGKDKIAAITQGILRKNQPQAEAYENAKAIASGTYAQILEIKKLQTAVTKQVAVDGNKNLTYSARKFAEQPKRTVAAGGVGMMEEANDSSRKHGGSRLAIDLKESDNEKDWNAMDRTDKEAEQELTKRLL